MVGRRDISMTPWTLEDASGSSAQGGRPTQQDRYMMLLPDKFPNERQNSHALFMVCDGHGSSKAAEHAIENIPQLILQSLDPENGSCEQAVDSAIRDEERLLFDQYCKGEDGYALAGTTVSVCLLDLTSGALVVGNLGDSLVLLGEVDEANPGKLHINRITRPHKPASPREKSRIEAAGGVIDMDCDTPRIGGLNMSRALGDLKYKYPLNNTAQSEDTPGEDYFANGNFISSEPTVTRIPLRDGCQYMLVLTSDGVTNVVSDEKLLRGVATLWRAGAKAKDISENIVEAVASHPQSDNATCVAIFLRGRDAEKDKKAA